MIITARIALKPNKEQEEKFKSWSGASRFIYNYALGLKIEAYKEFNQSISSNEITKIITELKNTSEKYSWLKEIPSQTIAQAVKDMDSAFQKFFKEHRGFPRFKKKRTSRPGFYTRYDKIYSKDEKHIKITGLKQPIKTYEKCLIPDKPSNPRITFDGKYWYLTYGYEVSKENINIPIFRDKTQEFKKLSYKDTTEAIGIDLGIINTATLSSEVEPYENINKSPEVLRLKAKKKRLQQQLSRKYELNKVGNKYIKTKNIIKLEHKIQLVQRSLNNIRHSYINKMTTQIVKTKPSKIVIEDLNVSGMMKNKYLAKSIQEQNWYEIRRQLTYKGALWQIPIEVADRFYPSSKLCSNCLNIKKGLKLSDRVYKCECCGLEIDRDLNAAINIKNYDENKIKIRKKAS